MKQFSIFPLVLLFCVAGVQTAICQIVRTDQVSAELVSENKTLIPGKTNTVAIRLEMADHWHTYWENPGDSGLPTTVDWKLPEGITAGPLQWPIPQWINYFDMISFAYEKEVFLLVDLEVSEDLNSGDTVNLSASVDWLACKEACIPGSADLKLSLQLSKETERSRYGSAISSTREALPQQLDGWEMKVVDNGESFALSVLAPEGFDLETHDTTYFTLDGWVSNAGPRTFLAEGRLLTLILPKSEYEPDEGKDRFKGVLASTSAWDSDGVYKALKIDLPFSENDELGSNYDTASIVSTTQPISSKITFSILLIAFGGGLILNLMPCVFPIIGIKIFGFANLAGEDRRQITIYGIVFSLGILISFFVLASILIFIRSTGESAGWGFQMQEPLFVLAIAALFLLLALNMSGVFVVGERVMSTGSSLASRSGLSGTFFSGVLATLAATPCSAPLLGVALGATLTLSTMGTLSVFTMIALGMSAPYLLLSAAPNLVRYLPKPGAWMESFKQFLAFPLYATVGYLLWVLSGQVDDEQFLNIFFAFTLISMAAWVYGRWGIVSQKDKIRTRAKFAALIIIISAGALGTRKGDESWQPWSPEKVAQLRSNNKPIYIDFTARWCATCQINKRNVLSSQQVLDVFKKKGVVTLKADWTNKNPLIADALAKYGKSAVPLNVIYLPDKEEPILLSEILTNSMVINALEEMK